ncbi:hypothetical protein DKG71_33420 [Streptomyces sp. NEAU-S7GS2]|nr:hypothetical protein DKG71_33420 [Streptomyces sp. NEAU-S7GS2]
MRTYLHMGAPGRATELLQNLQRRLRKELGVDPSPELVALVRQAI